MGEEKRPEIEAAGRSEPNAAMVAACRRNFGALRAGFLCQSVAILRPARRFACGRRPLCRRRSPNCGVSRWAVCWWSITTAGWSESSASATAPEGLRLRAGLGA